MKLRRGISVSALVDEMRACGVLGAGRIGKAAELTTEMFSDPEYTVFLTMAGALVPGGLREIVCDLVDEGYVDVVITTGANMVHDMVEALGYRHRIGTFLAEDKQLKAENIGRIGDIYIEQNAFKDLEKWMYKVLEDIPEEKREHIEDCFFCYLPSDILIVFSKSLVTFAPRSFTCWRSLRPSSFVRGRRRSGVTTGSSTS